MKKRDIKKGGNMSDAQNNSASTQEYVVPVIEIDAYAPAKMADKVGHVGVANHISVP